jgi:hypothetical protein
VAHGSVLAVTLIRLAPTDGKQHNRLVGWCQAASLQWNYMLLNRISFSARSCCQPTDCRPFFFLEWKEIEELENIRLTLKNHPGLMKGRIQIIGVKITAGRKAAQKEKQIRYGHSYKT